MAAPMGMASLAGSGTSSMVINGGSTKSESGASGFMVCPKKKYSSLRRSGASKRKSGIVSAKTGNADGDNIIKDLVKRDDNPMKIDYYGEKPFTPLLDTINYPKRMKNLDVQDLRQLAKELREEIIFGVSKTGDHLSANLGVVDLTVALHYVFDTPLDKIVWDVGHQSYPHKILTGRRGNMSSIRQTSGIAGFPKRADSKHDAFGAGHSSTGISAALGILNLE